MTVAQQFRDNGSFWTSGTNFVAQIFIHRLNRGNKMAVQQPTNYSLIHIGVKEEENRVMSSIREIFVAFIFVTKPKANRSATKDSVSGILGSGRVDDLNDIKCQMVPMEVT